MQTYSVHTSDAGAVLKPSSKSFSAGTCAFSAAPCSQASIASQRSAPRAPGAGQHAHSLAEPKCCCLRAHARWALAREQRHAGAALPRSCVWKLDPEALRSERKVHFIDPCASQRRRRQPWTALRISAAAFARRGSRAAPAVRQGAKRCRCRTTRCRRAAAPPRSAPRQPGAPCCESARSHAAQRGVAVSAAEVTHQQVAAQRAVCVREALAAVGGPRAVRVYHLQRVARPEKQRARAHAHCAQRRQEQQRGLRSPPHAPFEPGFRGVDGSTAAQPSWKWLQQPARQESTRTATLGRGTHPHFSSTPCACAKSAAPEPTRTRLWSTT